MNTLTWQNETSLTPYPLSKSIGHDTLIIDANFIQFDNFVPSLTKVEFGNESISLTIVFDRYTKVIEVLRSNFTGIPYAHTVKFADRYVGKIVFGADALALSSSLNNHELDVDVKFLAFLVKSIPSNAGVFKLDGMHGALHFTSDENISYLVTGQKVRFDAVSIPTLTDQPYLKTLNSIAPTSNNVFLRDSELIKVSSNGAATVLISLIGTGISDFIMEQNSTIPTNPNP